MLFGYAGKFLEIDLSTEKIKNLIFEEDILRQYFGGRGLAAKILWDRLGNRWETVDPLGSENILLVLTGPLTGFYPGARICISGKSPQSNGIIGSTVAGEFPVELKCSGYDGIILTGRASNPVYVLIKDDQVEIRDASRLWGKGGRETVKMLTKEVREELTGRHPKYGLWKEPAMVYIGPAGENRVRVACVMQKWTHAAGYGGYGAVMGAKNLKAIVAKGTGPLPEVSDLKKMEVLRNRVARKLYTYDRIRRWGTGYGGYETGAHLSSEPIRNWQEEWHDEKKIGGDKFDLRYWVKRYWGDFGCPTTCLKIAVIKGGPFKGTIGDNPDYELQAYLGPNLGIFDPEGIIYLSALVDDLGISGINGGNVLGFAAELYQRGVLTKEDLGMELRWGDVKAFAMFIKRIAKREGVGDLFADGAYRTALKIKELKGLNVMQYAIHVKGVEVGAHGIRSGLDFPPISYACSVQGGDHTSTVLDAYNDMDMVFADSAVICSINAWRAGYDLAWEFARSVSGGDTTRREWNTILAHRIIHIQRAVLILGGPVVRWNPTVDDDNPQRFYEPLPSGPKAGKTTDKSEFEEMKRHYYRNVGWDENGIPKSEVLRQLGLEDVDEQIAKLRK